MKRASAQNNKKILIVEDEAPMLRVLTDTFSHEGFTVIPARDGEEGITFALAKHPDLILLDLLLPKLDGMTVLKRLRADAWGKNVPVIILSNLSDAARVLEAVKNGVYDFLVKSDWKLDEVMKKVKSKLKMV